MKRITIILFTIIFSAILSVTVVAAPISDMPTVITQPDGTEIICLMSGDEYFNYYHDESGYVIKKSDDGWYEYCFGTDDGVVTSGVRVGDTVPENALTKETVYNFVHSIIEEAMELYEIPVSEVAGPENEIQNASYFTGTFNNIVIFICFNDEDTTVNSYIRENLPKLYNTGYSPDTSLIPKVSVKDYFRTVSNGHIDINTTFYPIDNETVYCYKAKNPRSYYQPYDKTSNPNGYTEGARATREFSLLQEAVDAVKSQIPGDLNLDVNNDGYVDSITFIVKGSSGAWSSLLWPHKWSAYSKYIYINGARVYSFSLTTEDHVYVDNSKFNISGIIDKYIEMGTLCHEMMHTFGMPDLYDYVNQSNCPIGYYDIMANNNKLPQVPTVYTRERWGIYDNGKTWVDGQTKTITSASKQRLTLKASSSNSGIIAFKIPYSLTGYSASASNHTGLEKTIYIEYRGILGNYECERTEIKALGKIISSSGSTYSYSSFNIGVSTGLLVYETSRISDNTRNGCSCSGSDASQDCYTLWAYRTNKAMTTQPTAFKEGSGDIFINLSNGAILKISNIDESSDKSEVTFDIEIFVNGDPTYGKTSDGFIISEFAPASTVLASLTTQYISWNSGGNCKYFNGTPTTDTNITMTILDNNGKKVSDTANVGTGYKVRVTSNASSLNKNIEIVVYGDLDGNASIDVNDMILLKKHLSSETGILNGAALYAANTDGTTGLTKADLLSLSNKILSPTNK